MLQIINLPQVGESIVEGTIAAWLKKPGETVKQYEPLVEVVTDKVTLEVPSPADGIITQLLAQEGDTVAVGSPILEVDVSNLKPPISEPEPSQSSRTGFLVDNITQVGPTGGTPNDNVTTSADTYTENSAPRISPAVKRLAQELSINLPDVTGTGLNGRITKNDILTFSKIAQEPPFSQPADPIRKRVADNMITSYTQIPHAWTMIEIDANDLVTTRSHLKERFEKETGFNLTFVPFFMSAVIYALEHNINFNAEWIGNSIKQHPSINLGFAVAATSGLIVPVIHDANNLTFKELAIQTNSLITKANTNNLELNDVQNGTFTINNTGALGSILSKPIINQNQSGIITMESITRRPTVIGDGISIRPIMNVCLSFDHRLNDGYEASKFVSDVKQYIENISNHINL